MSTSSLAHSASRLTRTLARAFSKILAFSSCVASSSSHAKSCSCNSSTTTTTGTAVAGRVGEEEACAR
jgi:hypothetical protein